MIRHVRLPNGKLAAVSTESGEVFPNSPNLIIYAKIENIPFEPFTEAELNRPNPLMDAAIAGTDIDASAPEEHRPRLPDGYGRYFVGQLIALGTDAHGHDYEFDYRTRKVQRVTSEKERRRICEYARRYGNQRAAVKFCVPMATVATWKHRSSGKRRQTLAA